MNLQSRLYLFDPLFDPVQPGCSISGTVLIRKVNTSVSISITPTGSRCLLIDDHGYLVTVLTPSSIIERYEPTTLTLIDRISVTSSTAMSLSFFHGAYFVGLASNNITVINSTSLTVINVISSTYLQNPRDMIFLDDGQTMVVAGYSSHNIVFFERTSPNSTLYSYASRIQSSYRNPFGLWRVNDTFFYGTSYTNSTILAYSPEGELGWGENLVIDARPALGINGGLGMHVTIDLCDRFWFSLDFGGALIYNRNGSLLGRFPAPYTRVADLLIMTNFTIFLSAGAGNKLYRLQPDLSC